MSASDPATAKKSKKSEKPSKSQKPKQSATSIPSPRPALRRAADADVHPVTGRTAVSLGAGRSAGRSFKPTKGGPTTADSIMGATGDKLVDLGVRVPKSVRKKLRQQAKARGVSIDELVASILTAALPRD